MFFFGIFGIQDKKKTIKDFSGIICPDCNKYSRAELITSYRYFHFFFIPIFKWNRKYYILLRCCGNIYEVDDEYARELINSDDIDFNRLYKITKSNLCPSCRNHINPAYRYCPFCGKPL